VNRKQEPIQRAFISKLSASMVEVTSTVTVAAPIHSVQCFLKADPTEAYVSSTEAHSNCKHMMHGTAMHRGQLLVQVGEAGGALVTGLGEGSVSGIAED
jgi:hypothetical protein